MNVLSEHSNARITLVKLRKSASSPLAVVLAVALLGLLVLEQVARWQEAPRAELDELGAYEGRTVVVRGIITEVRPLDSGGWQLEMSEGTVSTSVFAPNLEHTPFVGDLVEAQGLVKWYRGSWEIDCQSGQVRVLKSANRGSITHAELARAPQAYVGSSLTLRGEVRYLSNRSDNGLELLLFSLDAEHGLNVSIAPTLVGALSPIMVGDQVTLQGLLEYHAQRFQYRLMVQDEGHGVWLHEP